MLALVAVLLQQAPAPRPTDAAIVRAVDSLLSRAVDGKALAGASVLVARGGRVVVARGYGKADLEQDVPATERTVYRIGSLTKQFTAALILQLADSGRLRLDDELSAYVPDFPLQGRHVTIRQLLNHTSGIPSYTGLGPLFFERVSRLRTPPESILALVAGRPFDFEPGTSWRYDNTGYVLLGMVLEKVTGRPYAELIQERIARPLGLADTRYCDEATIVPRRARGYGRDVSGVVNAAPIDMSTPFAAGALCSTVGDLERWRVALTSGRVIRPDSYAMMIRPDTLSTGAALSYGYGLAPALLQGHRGIGHGGAINGFSSDIRWFPDDSVSVILLGNGEGNLVGQLATRVARAALGLPTPPRPSRPLPTADRDRFAGRYVTQGGDTLQVAAAGDGLELRDPVEGPTRLLFQGGATFRPDNDDPMVFFFVTEGTRVTGLRIRVDGRVVAELGRVGA